MLHFTLLLLYFYIYFLTHAQRGNCRMYMSVLGNPGG